MDGVGGGECRSTEVTFHLPYKFIETLRMFQCKQVENQKTPFEVSLFFTIRDLSKIYNY